MERLPPFFVFSARRQTFTLSITANKIVFWIENAPLWESCPPFFGKGVLKNFSPERVPPTLRERDFRAKLCNC